MILKNPQGCEVHLFPSLNDSVRKSTIFPTGNVASEVVTNKEAHDLVIKLITIDKFKINF